MDKYYFKTFSTQIVNSCLICCQSPGPRSAIKLPNFSSNLENNDNLDAHLWAVFVLRKVLNYPSSECVQLLQSSLEQPGNWFRLCGVCWKIVWEAFVVECETVELRKKFNVLKTTLRDKLQQTLHKDGVDNLNDLGVDEKLDARRRIRRFFKVNGRLRKRPSTSEDSHAHVVKKQLKEDGTESFELCDIDSDSSSNFNWEEETTTDLHHFNSPINNHSHPNRNDLNQVTPNPVKNTTKQIKPNPKRKKLTKVKKPIDKLCHGKFYKDKSVFIRDPTTGSITFTSTNGSNRICKRTVTLTFSKLEDNKGFQCVSCLKIVPHNADVRKLRRLFRAHLNEFHRSTAFRPGQLHLFTLQPQRKCTLCGYWRLFENDEDFLRHLKDIHGFDSQEEMSEHFKKYFLRTKNCCKICGMPTSKSFHVTPDFIPHKLSHMSPAEKTDFELYPRKRRRRYEPATEDELASGLVNQCDICGLFVSSGPTFLKAHKETHIPREERDRPYVCDLCGAGFLKKQYLQKHMKSKHINGKEKSHPDAVCRYPVCGQMFGDMSQLEKHVAATHTKIIPSANGRKNKAMCNKCGRLCRDTTGLKEHEKIHTGVKEFKCHLCSQECSSKKVLDAHLAGRHKQGDAYGQFACNQPGCTKVFPCRRYLGYHIRNSHGLMMSQMPGGRFYKGIV